MPKTRAKKEENIAKAKEALSGAESVVFVTFNGLSIKESDALRANLRKSDSRLQVVKKTLLKRALLDTKATGDIPELTGEVAFAYGPDPIAPAKGIADFRKGKEAKLGILGGIFEGRFMDAVLMNELALIPGRETLLGMLVNVINSPIQGLVIGLDAISKKKA